MRTQRKVKQNGMENATLLLQLSVENQRTLIKAFADGKLQRGDLQSKYLPALMRGEVLIICHFGGEPAPVPTSFGGVPISSPADLEEIDRISKAINVLGSITITERVRADFDIRADFCTDQKPT